MPGAALWAREGRFRHLHAEERDSGGALVPARRSRLHLLSFTFFHLFPSYTILFHLTPSYSIFLQA